jgi:hypothetical protein
MDIKRLAIGTIVGAITWQIVNYLIAGILLADFYAANLGSATGVFRDEVLQGWVALGCLPLGALLTWCIERRESAPTIANGFVTGALVSFAVWFHADFVIYGFTNIFNLTLTFADSVLSGVSGAVAGAVIAAVLARIPKGAGLQAAE